MKEYKFFAFISYRHTDVKAAKRLQSLLEGYSLPTEIRQCVQDAPQRFKIFRDTDELTSGVLSKELQKKLDESKFLIVICSPESAKSKYVGDEIAYFRSIGREKYIIPFIIDGVPHTDNECYHPQLTLGGLELLGIDVNAESGRLESIRFHKAFIRVVAKMLDLDYGVLWNRRKRYMIRKAVMISILTFCAIGAITYFAVKSHHERPFDATVALSEMPLPTTLPLSSDGRDSVYIYLDYNDVRRLPITSLYDCLRVPNIPGRYRGKDIRIVCSAFGCVKLDTIVVMSESVNLNVSRDPLTYGRICHFVMESDGNTPAIGAVFTICGMSATTDSLGLLDMQIPLAQQQPNGYPVSITYKGKERKVAFQAELDPMLDRTLPTTIMLED